ncbi:bifunctional DNA primase/polymerase-like protein [Halospina denitrificans]|uniref:Bifunctional DNA primase/polymerase-like protein n=1 Tax=Halospina denitrificans TaxID=332522 RepID=A0A4R7JTA8_9GAMM|nr:DUF3987 domain-containing protein [Halospina denitrificans]TDT41500.1 bifunctional DNA primase/polymerase-like protein [Halospina denitrificans]
MRLNENAPAAWEADEGTQETSGQAQIDYNVISDEAASALMSAYPCCLVYQKGEIDGNGNPSPGKNPKGFKWTDNPRKATERSATDGIGVICGFSGNYSAPVGAVDVDVTHEDAARELYDFISQYLKNRDGAKLVRTGKPPKFLIPYRMPEVAKKKNTTALYPVDAESGLIHTEREHKNQVEFLGKGEQFIAYHIHPDTGEPYQWRNLCDENAPQSLHECDPAELVELTADDLDTFDWAFNEIADRHRLEPKPKGDKDQSKPCQSLESAVHESEADHVDYLVSWIPNNDADYDDEWFPIIAAIHDAAGEAGKEIARKWSAQSGLHEEGKFEKTWGSMGSYSGKRASKGKLIALARENGMPRSNPRASTTSAQQPNPPEPDQWPTLADPFAEYTVPAFPLDILPNAFQTFCREKSEQSGFDEGGYAFCLLAAFGNTVDHRAQLDLGPFKVPAFSWNGLVDSSGGGKSPVLSASIKAPCEINDAIVRDSERAMGKWREELESAKQAKQDPPPKPPWKQRHASDTTTEALAQLLSDNPEGVNLYFDEMTEFLGRMDAYSGKDGGKDRGVYLRSWDGGQVTINRATKEPLVVPNFSVGILAGVQPEVLAQKFQKSGGASGADGLYQRFALYCMRPAGEVDYMAKLNPFTETNVTQVFNALQRWNEDETKLSASLTTGAQSLMQDYHNQVRKLATRTSARRFAEHLNKFPGMLGRFAYSLHLLYAAARDEPPHQYVDADTMKQAMKLMRVLYRHSEAVYAVLDQQAGDVKALVISAAEAILAKQWAQFKRGDLTRNATYWQGAESYHAESATDYLIEMGWIADITPPPIPGKRGRRSDGVFAVNPKVHAQFSEHQRRIKEARAERYQALKEVAGGN